MINYFNKISPSQVFDRVLIRFWILSIIEENVHRNLLNQPRTTKYTAFYLNKGFY